MAKFCIPKQLAAKLKEAASRGEINIGDLYDMNSAQRREFFKTYVDEKTAKSINAGFESAMVSEHKKALESWAKDVFVGKDKPKRKNVIDKINKLSDKDLLDTDGKTAFMEDLVGESLGVNISAQEAKKIDQLAEKLRVEEAKGLDEFGVYQDGYWVARENLDNYLLSLNPASKIRVTTSTTRRGLMLTSVKSPVVNITGNSVMAMEQAAERRIRSGQAVGSVEQKLLKDYRKRAVQIFKKSGFDVTRMQDIGEGRKTLGERITHSQGKGAIRKFGRVMEDIVFKKMLGEPDVWFSAYAQADSANLMATYRAKAEGLKGSALKKRATELFKDAMSISPTSDMGNRIRTQAIADAEFATFTNNGSMAEASLKARDFLNALQKDLAIGDQTVPFVKTPANAIQFSFDSAGISAARGLKKLPNAVKQMRLGNPDPLRDAYADLFRSGMGILGAIFLVNLFKPEDFMGMYPTNSQERELMRLKGATPNSVRIGDKWISLDYFGGFRGSLIGIMNAKKYGGNYTESLYNFLRGNVAQLADLPGVEQVAEVVEFVEDAAPEGKLDQEELVKRTKTLISDYSRSLVMPSILGDIAKAMDEAERQVDWNKPGDRWKAATPGMRETLDAKTDVFGTVLKGEPWYSVILFGARVKTARDGRVVEEVQRLDDAGQRPSLTRPEWTSSRVKTFKTQVSDEKFKEAMKYFRVEYMQKVDRLLKKSKYKRISDDEKRKEINDAKAESLDKALKRYGYKKPRK